MDVQDIYTTSKPEHNSHDQTACPVVPILFCLPPLPLAATVTSYRLVFLAFSGLSGIAPVPRHSNSSPAPKGLQDWLVRDLGVVPKRNCCKSSPAVSRSRCGCKGRIGGCRDGSAVNQIDRSRVSSSVQEATHHRIVGRRILRVSLSTSISDASKTHIRFKHE